MPNILIVDDDKAMTNLLKTLLEMEPEGFEVEIASSGSYAAELMADYLPDVVVIDYHLKDMKGVELIQKLRANKRTAQLPILVASGLDVEREVITAGANAFILKPFEPTDLPQLFLELMEQ